MKSSLYKLSLLFVMSTIAPNINAALLNLSTMPLFLTNNATSNLFFTMDDSGSMDWEILTQPHWHYCAYDYHAGSGTSSSDCGWEVLDGVLRSYGNGSYRYFEYMYQGADNAYNDDCSGSERNAIAACPSAGTADWRIFSSDVNVIYYNPTTNYLPWDGNCTIAGANCQNSSFTASRSNAREGTVGYSITRNLAGTEYHVWVDDKGYSGTRPRRGTNVNVTNTANNEKDLWDSHVKFIVNSGDIEVYSVTYNPNASGLNATTTLQQTLTDTSACYNVLGNAALVRQVFSGAMAYDSVGAPGCRSVTQTQQNMANWHEYSRRRGSNAKGAIAQIIDLYPNFRYGMSVINNYSQFFVEMPSSGANLSAHNLTILNQLFDYEWQALGTPLRRGLERTGKYFQGTLTSHPTSPITESCQQNFGVLMSDGYWNGSNPTTVNHDEDGDGYSGTLSDVAAYFYNNDLSALDDEVIPNPYDPATYQHMVSFMVSLGVTGNLVDSDGDGWPNPALAKNGNWGNPYSSNLSKQDDAWHAAFNSHGLYSAAQSPSELTQRLIEVLENIVERESSVSSVAQNTTTLQTDSQIFQATFHSQSWKGNLYAYGIDLQGNVATQPDWNAGCLLTGGNCALPVMQAANNPGKAPNDRVIITRNWGAAYGGMGFRWPADYTTLKNAGVLPTYLSDFLAYAPYDPNTTVPAEIAANQAYGQKLVDYLRGDRTEEVQNGGAYNFRDRESILGDIIHSDPLFIDKPIRYYPDSLEASPYSTFKNNYANRVKMVAAGSNDGMMHIFNSETGEELLAYVPGIGKLYASLPELSRPSYGHMYLVDGSSVENDVFYNNSWHSILSGTLRSGGQGVYSINITDPSLFTEGNANQIYMWDFTDQDDADIGYVYGAPVITKVNAPSGGTKWAVIFGNGYNNSEADGFASTTGKAYLYVLFVDGGLDGNWSIGTDYIKIEVGTGSVATPNGLSAPYAVDTDGDFITDYIYAGDLQGNLWKFDLRNASPSNWQNNVTTLFTASHQNPGDQPITSTPIVGAHPDGLYKGVMVYFGTGKYLENDDILTVPTTQSFYGIWDKLDGTTVTKADLIQQQVLSESYVGFDTDGDGTDDIHADVRHVSDNAVNWNEPVNPGDPAVDLGWYMDLQVVGASQDSGERQISRPLLRNNAIIFTTIIPESASCSFGGDSWLMELDINNGGRLDHTPIDFNNDNTFNTADYILVPDIDGDGNDDYVPAGGMKSASGITPTPAVFVSPGKDFEVKVLNGTGGLSTLKENPEASPQGRQNWKQIY